MKRRLKWLLLASLVLGASLFSFAQPKKAPKVYILPESTELKGALAPMPLPSGTSTRALLEQLKAAVEKGRALYSASQRFDESYRSFMGVVRFLQERNQPNLLCKSQDAAKAYLAASTQLGEFQVLRLQFAALLGPLQSASDQTLTPARKQELERVISYANEVSALAPIVDSLFNTQMRAEIEARGCKEESLRLVANDKSKKGLTFQPSITPPKPGTLPPAVLGSAPFSVNNIDCASPFLVFVDGVPVGTAGANSVTSFSTQTGPHQLCLAPSDDPEACSDPSNQVDSYIYEGWWIRAQCPGE